MIAATRRWFTAAALLTFASVLMGAVVCATESGASCPNWPGCYPDAFAPAVQLNPLIEFTHRVVAGATGPTVLVAALLGRRLADALPRRLAWFGLAGTLAAGVFGMLTVRVGIPFWLGMVDLGCALAATVAMLLARHLLAPGARWVPARAARLAWAGVLLLASMHVLGIPVAGTNSFTRCVAWPLGVLDADRWPWLQLVRVVLGVAAATLLVLAAWRSRRSLPSRVTLLVPVLLVLELALGRTLVAAAGDLGLRTAYAVVAVFLFGASVLLAVRGSVLPPVGDLPGMTPVPAGTAQE